MFGISNLGAAQESEVLLRELLDTVVDMGWEVAALLECEWLVSGDGSKQELGSAGHLCSDPPLGAPFLPSRLPKYACQFIEMCLMVTADHGPAVSGAHNTIICARAGKDLVSSLTSGLLTIVSTGLLGGEIRRGHVVIVTRTWLSKGSRRSLSV